jgi:hypothetical protein
MRGRAQIGNNQAMPGVAVPQHRLPKITGIWPNHVSTLTFFGFLF